MFSRFIAATLLIVPALLVLAEPIPAPVPVPTLAPEAKRGIFDDFTSAAGDVFGDITGVAGQVYTYATGKYLYIHGEWFVELGTALLNSGTPALRRFLSLFFR